MKDTNAEVRTHLRAEKVALWNSLLPSLIPDREPEAEKDYVRWIFLGSSLVLLLIVVLLGSLVIHGKKGKKYSQLLRGNSGTSYSVNL